MWQPVTSPASVSCCTVTNAGADPLALERPKGGVAGPVAEEAGRQGSLGVGKRLGEVDKAIVRALTREGFGEAEGGGGVSRTGASCAASRCTSVGIASTRSSAAGGLGHRITAHEPTDR